MQPAEQIQEKIAQLEKRIESLEKRNRDSDDFLKRIGDSLEAISSGDLPSDPVADPEVERRR